MHIPLKIAYDCVVIFKNYFQQDDFWFLYAFLYKYFIYVCVILYVKFSHYSLSEDVPLWWV